MNKFVQAIIINNSSVLCKIKYNENNQIVHLPVSSEILNGDSPTQAVEKLIMGQFNLPFKILLKLGRNAYSNTDTFLVDINNIDSIREDIESRGFKWVSLNDKDSFSYNEKLQLGNLLLSCIDNNYYYSWMEPVRNIIASDSRLSLSNSLIIGKMRSSEHKDIDTNTPGKEKSFAVLSAILLGFIYNQFFFSGTYGVSYPIFTLIVILTFLYNYKRNVGKSKPMGVFLLCVTFILSLSFGIHSNMILNLLNTMAVPLLLTASFILLRYEHIEWGRSKFILSVFGRIIPLTFENMFKPFLFIKGSIKKKEKSKLNPQTRSILIGLIVSVPLLIVILPLLSSADSVFGYYTSSFYTNFTNINIENTIWDIIKIAVAALYLFGFFWSFRYSYGKDAKPAGVNGKLEPVTVLTVLIVINLVYLFFTVIQFSYLYGGKTLLPNGFTYAEYARRGFFELVLVTIINFTILIAAILYTKKENSLKVILNIAYTLLVAFTFNMLYSAHYKMSLYESAFGYTYLRIFVHFFLLLLFILFSICLAGIWVRKIPAAKLSVIAALLMYVFINFINVDSIIVRKNIERYHSTGKIDVYYLTTLSYDAVPHVMKFAKENTNNDSISKKLSDYYTEKKKALNRDRKWFEFNYSKFMAKKVLNEE